MGDQDAPSLADSGGGPSPSHAETAWTPPTVLLPGPALWAREPNPHPSSYVTDLLWVIGEAIRGITYPFTLRLVDTQEEADALGLPQRLTGAELLRPNLLLDPQTPLCPVCEQLGVVTPCLYACNPDVVPPGELVMFSGVVAAFGGLSPDERFRLPMTAGSDGDLLFNQLAQWGWVLNASWSAMGRAWVLRARWVGDQFGPVVEHRLRELCGVVGAAFRRGEVKLRATNFQPTPPVGGHLVGTFLGVELYLLDAGLPGGQLG